MERRVLGRTGRLVSVVGLGTWQLGADWGDVDEGDARAVLDASAEAGVTFFDTADVYGDGRSEALIGRWLVERTALGALHARHDVRRERPPHLQPAWRVVRRRRDLLGRRLRDGRACRGRVHGARPPGGAGCHGRAGRTGMDRPAARRELGDSGRPQSRAGAGQRGGGIARVARVVRRCGSRALRPGDPRVGARPLVRGRGLHAPVLRLCACRPERGGLHNPCAAAVRLRT